MTTLLFFNGTSSTSLINVGSSSRNGFYKANVARCAAYVAMYLNANNFGKYWPETIVSINSGVLRYVRDPVKCMQRKRRDLAVGGSRVGSVRFGRFVGTGPG
jgi:hypothetical protein